jgi:hypothetical protein
MENEDNNTVAVENVVKFPGAGKNKKSVTLTAAEAAALANGLSTPDTITTITPDDFDTHEDYLRRINIENLCNTFAMEIYFKLLNMGYSVNTREFATDMEFAQEALHSALLRTFGEGHPIQEYVDENFELVTVQTTTKELDT